MIHHVSIGVSDISRSLSFYCAVFAPLQIRCIVDLPGRAGFGNRYPYFWILSQPAMSRLDDVRHIALQAPSESAVRAFYDAAIEFGGRCDGEPGVRAYTICNGYSAFVRDPDGNKCEAVWFSKEL